MLASCELQNGSTMLPLSRKQLNLAFIAGVAIVGPVWALTFANSTFRLGTLSGYLLLQLIAVASFTDLRERKIPNWATYSSFALGLLLNAFASTASTTDVSWLGAVGLGDSLAGGLGLLAVMLAVFSLTGGGAGDVKLAACLGALLGWQTGVDAVLFSFIVGGSCVMAYSVWKHGPLYLLTAMFRSVGSVFLPLYIPRPDKSQNSLLFQKLPLAPFFAIGTLIAVFRDQAMFLAN